jgi:multiple sugar transport system substrate-binding protein
MKKSAGRTPTRRDVARGIGAAGLGAAATGPLARRAFAQTKQPVSISFWTFDNPQQRPWVHKRVRLFMEQNPHIKVDFQWFAFTDLGKKISVGYATGTAPDGFVSQDWFMPTWLDKGLLAPLDPKQLGYGSYDAFTGDFAKAFVDGATKDGKIYGFPMWFNGYCNYLDTKQFKEAGLDADKD